MAHAVGETMKRIFVEWCGVVGLCGVCFVVLWAMGRTDPVDAGALPLGTVMVVVVIVGSVVTWLLERSSGPYPNALSMDLQAKASRAQRERTGVRRAAQWTWVGGASVTSLGVVLYLLPDDHYPPTPAMSALVLGIGMVAGGLWMRRWYRQ